MDLELAKLLTEADREGKAKRKNTLQTFDQAAVLLRDALLIVLDPTQEDLAARGRSTFSELRWYPPMEAAKGLLSWVFRAKQPESVRTGP